MLRVRIMASVAPVRRDLETMHACTLVLASYLYESILTCNQRFSVRSKKGDGRPVNSLIH